MRFNFPICVSCQHFVCGLGRAKKSLLYSDSQLYLLGFKIDAIRNHTLGKASTCIAATCLYMRSIIIGRFGRRRQRG